MRAIVLTLAAALVSGAARAEVADVNAAGFEVRHTATFAAPPDKVWAALGRPGQWWNSAHTWSGSAANLSLELKPGGCWCEALPASGGGMRHMQVFYVDPPKVLRLEGALGPLAMTGAYGHMSFTLAPKDGGTALTWTYDVGGYVKGGVDKFAAPVDQVMAEQFARLKALVETGKAD